VFLDSQCFAKFFMALAADIFVKGHILIRWEVWGLWVVCPMKQSYNAPWVLPAFAKRGFDAAKQGRSGLQSDHYYSALGVLRKSAVLKLKPAGRKFLYVPVKIS
jgi:hypothetical protein